MKVIKTICLLITSVFFFSNCGNRSMDVFVGTYTFRAIQYHSVSNGVSRSETYNIYLVIHPDGRVVHFNETGIKGVVGKVSDYTNDAVVLHFDFDYDGKYALEIPKGYSPRGIVANSIGRVIVLEKSTNNVYFSVDDFENKDLTTPTIAKFQYERKLLVE